MRSEAGRTVLEYGEDSHRTDKRTGEDRRAEIVIKSAPVILRGCCQKFHGKREAKHETAEVAEENQE
jgi:hypothetical protein